MVGGSFLNPTNCDFQVGNSIGKVFCNVGNGFKLTFSSIGNVTGAISDTMGLATSFSSI